MEFRQLEYFVHVANSRSITRSAAALHISQPALSRILKRLEEDAGFPLLVRTKTEVYLTRQGQTFLAAVNSALGTLQQAIAVCRGSNSPLSATVSVAVSFHDMGDNTMLAFQREMPNIQIKRFLLPPDAIESRLLSQYVDFAITPNIFSNPQIGWRPLLTDELLLEVHRNHPFFGKGMLPLSELIAQRFVMDDTIYDRPSFERSAADHSLIPCILFQGNSHHLAREYFEENDCVSLVPISAILDEIRESLPPQYLRLEQPIFKRVIGIAQLNNHQLSPIATSYLEYVRTYYSDLKEIIDNC